MFCQMIPITFWPITLYHSFSRVLTWSSPIRFFHRGFDFDPLLTFPLFLWFDRQTIHFDHFPRLSLFLWLDRCYRTPIVKQFSWPLCLILIFRLILPLSNLQSDQPSLLSLDQTSSVGDSSNHQLYACDSDRFFLMRSLHRRISFVSQSISSRFIFDPMPYSLGLKFGLSIPYNQWSYCLAPVQPFYDSSSGDLLSQFRSTSHNLYFINSSIDLNPNHPSFLWSWLILLFLSLPSHNLILVFVSSGFHLLTI